MADHEFFEGMDSISLRCVKAGLRVYHTQGGLTNHRLDDQVELAVGDVLSAILPGSSTKYRVTPNAARIVALDQKAVWDVPGGRGVQHGIQHHFYKVVEIDRLLPEGTPLFKDGNLAGLTLLGTRCP